MSHKNGEFKASDYVTLVVNEKHTVFYDLVIVIYLTYSAGSTSIYTNDIT